MPEQRVGRSLTTRHNRVQSGFIRTRTLGRQVLVPALLEAFSKPLADSRQVGARIPAAKTNALFDMRVSRNAPFTLTAGTIWESLRHP
jgi:hypothetical protein